MPPRNKLFMTNCIYDNNQYSRTMSQVFYFIFMNVRPGDVVREATHATEK
jgi:hypothetical protein